jgi:N-methylhydantoinase A
MAALTHRFHDRYVAAYGSTIGGPIELVSFRARVTSPVAGEVGALDAVHSGSPVASATRAAYFPELGGWVDTPVMGRAAIPASGLPGPVIIEEPDSTTVVPAGWSASLGPADVIALEAAVG